ncbi:hypothetical protein [Clostridium tertium]|uniref:hypothetical protein n=1 Tax=Clostridium tertium TaxID=1559 RepID=UPI000BE39460|nr:hypothetical protein [Clostridium tertium]
MKRKVLCICLMIVMCTSLIACSKNSDETTLDKEISNNETLAFKSIIRDDYEVFDMGLKSIVDDGENIKSKIIKDMNDNNDSYEVRERKDNVMFAYGCIQEVYKFVISNRIPETDSLTIDEVAENNQNIDPVFRIETMAVDLEYAKQSIDKIQDMNGFCKEEIDLMNKTIFMANTFYGKQQSINKLLEYASNRDVDEEFKNDAKRVVKRYKEAFLNLRDAKLP